MAKYKIGDIVRVVWIDAATDTDNWLDFDDIDTSPHICISYGKVVEANKPDYLVLAGDRSVDRITLCRLMYIPEGTIGEVTVMLTAKGDET